MLVVKLEKKGIKMEIPGLDTMEIIYKVKEIIDNDPELEVTGVEVR